MPATRLALQDAEYAHVIATMKQRFERHMFRHSTVAWEDIADLLHNNQQVANALIFMENTGGEPDLVGGIQKDGAYWIMDCVKESPIGRRSLCYDEAAWQSRKENKPSGSALALAAKVGIALLDEDLYGYLQSFGPIDTKTSSWLDTPAAVRSLGGALFGDYRYGRVFTYHNGTESYYAARGFRGVLKVSPH